MSEPRVVFLLYEVATAGRVEQTVIDVFSNWKDAEDARVGLNSQREHWMVHHEVVQWTLR